MKARLGLALLLAGSIIASAETTQNVIVYHDKEHFAGWPANEGMWSWGDEILVGYNIGKFEERGDKHSFVGDESVAFSRSLDGGETWTREEHPEVRPPKAFGKKELPPFPADVDFTLPGFTMKTRGAIAFLSTNRGHDWSGPYRLPQTGKEINARTSYIVTGKKSCLFFLPCTVRDERGERSRSFVAETSDGGQTLTFLSWIGDDLAEQFPKEKGQDAGVYFSTMPAAVKLDDGSLICSVRNRINRRKWTDIFESKDDGRSWTKISELEKGSTNPAALVALGGKRVVAVYGSRRSTPAGLAAKISADGGHTWSTEKELRRDGRKWDLGYTRAALRPDGKVVTLYYYTTEELPEQHISATIWRP